jgi:hypothetical protein
MANSSASPSGELQLDIVRFSDLALTKECCDRMDASIEQVRSLKAHPYARPDDAVAVTLRRDGRQVGRIGLFPGKIQIGEERFPLSWGSGWGFDGDPRNRAAAGLLLIRAFKEAKSLGGFGISEVANPIYRAAKFDLITLPRFILLFRSKAVLTHYVGSEVLARALAIPADAVLALSRRALALGFSRRGYTVQRIERFDPEVARINALARGPFYFPRDDRELNWVLENPWHGAAAKYGYQAFYVRNDSGSVVGYALARQRFFAVAAGFRDLTLGSVLTFAVDPRAEGAGETLFAAVIASLEDSGADAVEVCTLNVNLHVAAKRLGGRRVGELRAGLKLTGDAKRALTARGATLQSFAADMGEGDMIFG